MGAVSALCHVWAPPAASARSRRTAGQPSPRPPGSAGSGGGRAALLSVGAGPRARRDGQPGTTHRCQPPFPRERCSLTSDVCLGFCSVKNSFTQQLTCRGWRLTVGCAREAFSGRINYFLRPRIFDLRTQINFSSMQETGSQSSKPSILLPETHEKGKFLCNLAVTEPRYQG